MKKLYRHVHAVLGRIILIGLSIQIFLGILWMCCNFGRFQEFEESRNFIEVSKSFLFDEYTGALYPALLVLGRGIEDILHIPYTYFIQPLQLAAAFLSGFVLLRAAGIKDFRYRVYGSLVILTVPAVMQCHLAVLPYSLNLSAVLLEIAFVTEAVREERMLQGRQLVKANVCWLVSALLLPDYLYLGCVPVLLWWIYDAWKYRRQKGRNVFEHFLLIAAFAGMIAGTNILFQEPGCYGRPEKTVDAALFRRLNWGNLEEGRDDWPEDMREVCSEEFMIEVNLYPENMELMLQPRLEQELGVERAREIYRELNSRALESNFGKILHQIVWDVCGYTAPSVILRMVLTGRGYDSYAGMNYAIMKMKSPFLTKYYVNYSGWWMAAGVVSAAGGTLCTFLISWGQRRKKKMAAVTICVLTAAAMVVWYTMQGAGIWDYKKGLFAAVLWMVWMVYEAWKAMNEEKRNA